MNTVTDKESVVSEVSCIHYAHLITHIFDGKQTTTLQKINKKIHTDQMNAHLGYALINFANLKTKLVFNSNNPRSLDMGQVGKIKKFIEKDGLQNHFPRHAMIVVTKEKYLVPATLSKDSDGIDFQLVQFADGVEEKDVEFDLLAGQHRYHWLLMDQFATELAERNKSRDVVEAGGSAAKVDAAKRSLSKAEERLKDCVWLVQFYDKGLSINL